MSKEKSKKTKENADSKTDPNRSKNSKGNYAKTIYSILTVLGGLGFFHFISDRYSKHEDLEVELSKLILVIEEGDKLPASKDIETGWLGDRIDKKLSFIKNSQGTKHLELKNILAERFESVTWGSDLATLKIATQAYTKVERDSHKNFLELQAMSDWKFIEINSNKNGVAMVASMNLPIPLMFSNIHWEYSSSYSTNREPIKVDGIFIDELPIGVKVGTYPYIDLGSDETKKHLTGIVQKTPVGAKYFIPSLNSIRSVESLMGIAILPGDESLNPM